MPRIIQLPISYRRIYHKTIFLWNTELFATNTNGYFSFFVHSGHVTFLASFSPPIESIILPGNLCRHLKLKKISPPRAEEVMCMKGQWTTLFYHLFFSSLSSLEDNIFSEIDYIIFPWFQPKRLNLYVSSLTSDVVGKHPYDYSRRRRRQPV